MISACRAETWRLSRDRRAERRRSSRSSSEPAQTRVVAGSRPGLDDAGFAAASVLGPVVTRADGQIGPGTRGQVLAAISNGIVALLTELYGHAPTRTRCYYEDDLVVCVQFGGFSRVEQTLLEGGHGGGVIGQRIDIQHLMRERFEAVIARATGRRVIGFMSGTQHPDVISEVFILAPTDPQTMAGTPPATA